MRDVDAKYLLDQLDKLEEKLLEKFENLTEISDKRMEKYQNDQYQPETGTFARIQKNEEQIKRIWLVLAFAVLASGGENIYKIFELIIKGG